MAVLAEAISVVVRRDRINESYPGGWDQYVKDCPNQTLCGDAHLARIGFMVPIDVRRFIDRLEERGLTFRDPQGNALDIVVVDQLQGPTTPCDWIETGIFTCEGQSIRACRAVGCTDDVILTPDGWTYEGSLSHTCCFVSLEGGEKSVRFLERRDGLEAWLNLMTGKPVYVGRTSSGPALDRHPSALEPPAA